MSFTFAFLRLLRVCKRSTLYEKNQKDHFEISPKCENLVLQCLVPYAWSGEGGNFAKYPPLMGKICKSESPESVPKKRMIVNITKVLYTAHSPGGGRGIRGNTPCWGNVEQIRIHVRHKLPASQRDIEETQRKSFTSDCKVRCVRVRFSKTHVLKSECSHYLRQKEISRIEIQHPARERNISSNL